MIVTPSADGVFQADGLTFYRATLGKFAPNQSFTLELAYAKSSPGLSSPAAQSLETPVAPVPPAEPEPPRLPVVLWAWIVAGIAIAVAIGAIVIAARRKPPAAG